MVNAPSTRGTQELRILSLKHGLNLRSIVLAILLIAAPSYCFVRAIVLFCGFFVVDLSPGSYSSRQKFSEPRDWGALDLLGVGSTTWRSPG